MTPTPTQQPVGLCFDKTQPEGFPNAQTGNGTKTLSNGIVLTTTYQGSTPTYIPSTPRLIDFCDGFYWNNNNSSLSSNCSIMSPSAIDNGV